MKIRTLFLKAFGPFTDATLDFSGPANLHLIYGANEAGKSSALRAMGDLRYGIPTRSSDDFVHPFKDMLLAGCFEDAAGRAIGLARRKGNKDTLMGADPHTGAPVAGSMAAPEVLLGLTGGVAREQFQTMYGLDSAHLRQGGQLLIQGDGELGAALFEASTGSAGIKQMLDTLQADAKKFFVPRGQLPIFNEALRQLDDARHRYKQAVTKPEQWKSLKRAHEEAELHLATVRATLAAQRRRLAELAELGAVEPLLQALALKEADWAEVQHHVALAPDARERRLAALQQSAQAQGALHEAEAALAQCRQDLQALRIEPLLLTHAPAIDRLESDVQQVRRERESRIKLQAAIDAEASQLRLQAARMMGPQQPLESLEAFFRQVPSAASQAELAHALEAFQSLTLDLQHAQAQLASAGRRLAQLEREVLEAPAPALQQALSQALRQARSLGDAHPRLSQLQAAQDAEKRRLARSLADLGLASLEDLTRSRWLASAEIDAYERERGELRKRAEINESESQKIQADWLIQQRRRKSLAASGEVVTADTLQNARDVRQARWQAIRSAFIDSGAPGSARAADGADLPALSLAFERAQAEADRQADLLREGAQRAAEIAECNQRINDMTQALATLHASEAEQAAALAALDVAWRQALAGLGLPDCSAAALREWLALRQSALDQHERLHELSQAHGQLAQQVSAATSGLLAALQALGRAPAQESASLDDLTALGTAAEHDMVAARTALQRRASDMAALTQEIESDQASVARLGARMAPCKAALDEKSRAVYLPPDAASEAIQARLAELQRWVHDYQLHVEHLQQLRAMTATEKAAVQSAQALGELLQVPLWEPLDAWLDSLTERLNQSREAALRQSSLAQREAEELRRQQRAQAELAQAAQVLAELMAQAGVLAADELPEAETRSNQRRQVAERLRELKDQLAKASRKDAAALRAELASLDSLAIATEKEACAADTERLELDEKAAIEAEQSCRAALAKIDTSDEAAQAREEMEAAIARYRAGVRPWAQLKLAEALLAEALRRHREKAQGPVVALASEYFSLMTGGRFKRLLVDAEGPAPLLLAQSAQGRPMEVSALSEGTADQLYLSLRLAALELQRQPERMMPLVLDDVLMTADDERAANMFRALEKFAAQAQVMVFTHHRHLMDIARASVPTGLRVHQLASVLGRNG